MIDFEVDQLQLVGLRTLVSGDLNTLVGTYPFALSTRDAEMISGIGVDVESQSSAKVRGQIFHFVRIDLGCRLSERVNEDCFQSFTYSLETLYCSVNQVSHGKPPRF